MYTMKNLSQYNIVVHVHDEVIIESDKDTELEDIIEIMSSARKYFSYYFCKKVIFLEFSLPINVRGIRPFQKLKL